MLPQNGRIIFGHHHARCFVGQYERLVLMAEDELTEYSTDARKMEKLRRKIGLSVNLSEQQQVKQQLQAELPQSGIVRIVEEQRQTVALPFWGIAGLGLLLGISFMQPLDFVATIAGGIAAVQLQKWGWRLQAKRLMLNTLEEIEDRRSHPEKYPD
jgi:hypothetical protein